MVLVRDGAGLLFKTWLGRCIRPAKLGAYMRKLTQILAGLVVIGFAMTAPAMAQAAKSTSNAGTGPKEFTTEELVQSGHKFFGSVSQGLASVVEAAVKRWGQPNGYILGQEAAGAIVAGLRYGEGTLYTKNAGDRAVYWQGPSVGFDFGGNGNRVMMLVYNLPSTDAVYRRFAGVDGTAYFIGGFGATALMSDNIVVVPISAGVGGRLGVNFGYLKFTEQSTWNPF